MTDTLKGIGPGGWDKHTLANSQGQHADKRTAERMGLFKTDVAESISGVVYRLYTEDSDSTRESLIRLVSRYFDGATITYGVGVWQGATERNATVEIVAAVGDLQKIVNLAGDIRFVHGQTAVLVTWAPVSQLLVTVL